MALTAADVKAANRGYREALADPAAAFAADFPELVVSPSPSPDIQYACCPVCGKAADEGTSR